MIVLLSAVSRDSIPYLVGNVSDDLTDPFA